MIPATCPICSYTVATPFFAGGEQPLATLGWPTSQAEAKEMARLPLDFVQCPACTHVWNRSFSYESIPYQQNPNRMFNRGTIWTGHLDKTRSLLLDVLGENPTVVDIGCGEGHFVRGLAAARKGNGRFMGFDPNGSPGTGKGVEFHARLFEPLVDVERFQPDAAVMRHILEHLTDPAMLVEQLAWAAATLDKPCWLFAEMPCIDRVFETGRLADFYFEHPSQFTTLSFRSLMQRAGEVVALDHGYDGEVVYALVRLGFNPKCGKGGRGAGFQLRARESRARIRWTSTTWRGPAKVWRSGAVPAKVPLLSISSTSTQSVFPWSWTRTRKK